MCRIDNSLISKTKYTNSEIEAAETYDRVALYLMGSDCFINFEEKREYYLNSDLDFFYKNVFLKVKDKRKDGYFKDDSELLNLIKPLIWKMSIPDMSKNLNLPIHKITWCIKKHNLEKPGKNYWQKK